MTLYNVTFTDVDVERTITLDTESEELANYIAKSTYGREPAYAWDGVVTLAPEPPPTVLDKDNVEHPDYLSFADADPSRVPGAEPAPEDVAPEAQPEVPAE